MIDGVLFFVTGTSHVYFRALMMLATSLSQVVLYFFTFEMQEVKELLTWKGEVLAFMRLSARRAKLMVYIIIVMMVFQSALICL